jgi:hypothetical protein
MHAPSLADALSAYLFLMNARGIIAGFRPSHAQIVAERLEEMALGGAAWVKIGRLRAILLINVAFFMVFLCENRWISLF